MEIAIGKGEDKKRHIPGILAYNLNRLMPIVNSELGILTSSGIFNEPVKEEYQRMEENLLKQEALPKNVNELREALPKSVNELQLPDTNPQASMSQGQPATAPGMTGSENFLRNQEIEKLMGGAV